MNICVRVFVALFLLVVVVPCSAAKFVLVEDGVARCTVVLPKDATSSMEYGANDISLHLKLMSGADVRVHKQQSDSDLPGDVDGLIVVTSIPDKGDSPTANEALRITTKPGKPWIIRIYGDNRRGAMYGCYAFLEDVLGCRWFTSKISKTPSKKTITVGKLNIHQKPAFEYREPYYKEALQNREWAVRNRTNGNASNINASVGGKISYGRWCHTMFELVPPDKYFESHPEYFALVNGKRVRNTQLCLTNPDVLRISISSVKEWIKGDPQSTIFSVSQMDGCSGACQCENCKKVKEEEGAESGVILRFVNAIAKEIGRDYPNVLIDTLAYNYSQIPPKHVKPLPNVRIRLCTINGCKAHPLESTCNQKDFSDLRAWAKITNQIYMWDYNTDFWHFLILHPSLNYTKSVYDTYKHNGVVGIFMHGSQIGVGGSLAEIKSYLSAKLMWNPERDAAKLLDEYVAGVYGKAAPVVKKWLDVIHSPFEGNRAHLGVYDHPDAPYLTREVLDKSYELLAEARSASADEPVVLDELRKIEMWLDYTRLAQIKPGGSATGGKYVYDISDQDVAAVERLIDSMKHFDVTSFGEVDPFNYAEFITRDNCRLDCLSLDNDKLHVDVLPTVGGKIVRLIDKKRSVDLMLPPESVFRGIDGGYEEYIAGESRDGEFTGTHFVAESQDNTITLKGTSSAGREITKTYAIDDNKLILKTSVRNSTKQPLEVRLFEHPQFPLHGFEDISEISFVAAGGSRVALDSKKFTGDWLWLKKTYKDAEIPAGRVVFKLKETTIAAEFDSNRLDSVEIKNDIYATRISLDLRCKSTMLQPNESTSFEQVWTID